MQAQRLGEVLPGVMENIKNRCNCNRSKQGLLFFRDETKANHKARVLSAVGGFFSGKKANKKRG